MVTLRAGQLQYELADVFIGARDQDELNDKFDRATLALHFEFDE